MRILLLMIAAITSGLHGLIWADDACSDRAIQATATVQVSDGSAYRVTTGFQSVHHAWFQQIQDDHTTLISVEGPTSWVRQETDLTIGSEFHKLFALGHQFHAFLLNFDELTLNPKHSTNIEFRGENRSARTGGYPYGGTVHLIEGAIPDRPLGLLFEFPDIPPISVLFADWRPQMGISLPFELTIDDGERVFTYAYQNIETENKAPGWFMQALGPVDLDEVGLYRLHRKLLIAHCEGDAEAMANLSTTEILSANRGQMSVSSRTEVRQRFESLFQMLDYTSYRDLQPPIIEIGTAGDLALIGVEVKASGKSYGKDLPFDDQWSWFMFAKKVDGEWKHAGNASNRRITTP